MGRLVFLLVLLDVVVFWVGAAAVVIGAGAELVFVLGLLVVFAALLVVRLVSGTVAATAAVFAGAATEAVGTVGVAGRVAVFGTVILGAAAGGAAIAGAWL